MIHHNLNEEPSLLWSWKNNAIMRQILKMIGIWATAGSFLFPACQPVPEVPVLSYPLPEQVRTDGETVFREGKDSVSRVYLIKDILCKVYNRGEKSFALALENLEPGFPSRSYVKYGGLNEDEMMLTLASRGPEGILLHDWPLERMAYVDVEKALSDSLYEPDVFPCDVVSQEVIPLEGHELLYLNRYSWEEGAPRFYRTNGKGNQRYHRKGRKDGFSILNGELILNKVQGKVAFADRRYPVVEIWSLDGKLQKRIQVEEERSFEIRELEIGGKKDYYFVNVAPCCFASGAGTDSTLALAYQNAEGESSVYIMDWEGVLHQSFKVSGKVKEISLSVSGEDVYCWSSFDDEDRLVRYSL